MTSHPYADAIVEKGEMKHVQADHLRTSGVTVISSNPKSMFPRVEGGPGMPGEFAMLRITLNQSKTFGIPLRDSLEHTGLAVTREKGNRKPTESADSEFSLSNLVFFERESDPS